MFHCSALICAEVWRWLQAPALLQSSVHGYMSHDQSEITSSDILQTFSSNLSYVLKTNNRATDFSVVL